MTIAKRFSFALAFTCLALSINAGAQTPSIEVSADIDNVEFAAHGRTRRVHVEVYAPSGELIFETHDSDGHSIRWPMLDGRGVRVSDGVYLATITVTDTNGKRRKRIEQLVVSGAARKESSRVGASPEPLAVDTITGEGASGKLAKFTGANVIGNSILTESSGKIGVSIASPTARLHVNGPQPPASSGNGTNAAALLQVTGGRGGNTTGAAKAGDGASISIAAGAGGNAPAGGVNGNGGNITLQPGAAGTGGVAGFEGSLLLAPDAGNVGVGTTTPAAKLGVEGVSGGYLVDVKNGTTSSLSGFGIRSVALGYGVYGSAENSGVYGFSPGGEGIHGNSDTGKGVYGFSDSGRGVQGASATGYAGYFSGKTRVSGDLELTGRVTTDLRVEGNESFGSTTRQMINLYNTSYGIGVQSGTQYYRTGGGFAWFKGGSHSNTQNSPGGGTRLMRLDSSGNLYTAGAINPPSDRSLKAGFSAVNPRSVLDRLASIPIRSWHYRSEPETVRHLGPVAQDFKAAFDLGADDRHISTVDADGVMMASIQALYQQNQELAAEVRQLRARLLQQQAQLNQVKRVVRRRISKR